MNSIEALRRQVIEVAQTLPNYGLVWMAGGTICARDPETGLVVVTPSGMSYDDLTHNDMIVTDMDLNVVKGDHRPSVALNLWVAFFRARPELNAVVHTHSPFATAFSVIGEPIPIITETQANWFGGPVPVTPYLSVDDPRFASLPVEVLGEGFGVLLGQHGVITLGADLRQALERAVTLEEAARTYSIARTIGKPMTFSPEMARNSFNYYHDKYGQRTETKE